MNDDLQQKIAAALERDVPMSTIAQRLASHENPEYSSYGKSWIESQAAAPTKRSDYQEEKKNLTGTITPVLDWVNENPKTALGVGAAAIGIPYAIKTKNAIEDRKMKRELHESEIKKNAAYAKQVELQAQKLTPSTELTHADVADMVKKDLNVAGKPNPLAASFEKEFGIPLAEAEQMTGGKITNPMDAKIIGNALTKGQGVSVNPMPGTVSNQPAGIPSAVNPMTAFGKTAPSTPSVSDAVATGGNVTKTVNQITANQLDTITRAEKEIPVLKAQSAGLNQYLNMFGFQKKDPTSPRSLAAIDATNKLLEQGFQGIPPKGVSGNPEGYRNQYIPFVEQNANILAPETQEHLNKSRTKAQVGTVNKLIETGIPLSEQGKASLGGMAATVGAAAIPALAAAGYHAYKGNKEAVNTELKDAWNSMKSVVTMPVDVAKAAGKGDFGPFKDMLMSMNPGTLLMNEANKRDEAAIQRMIQAEKVGAGRGIAPPSAYQR